MFSIAASPATDTLPEELSRLGIGIPDQALQRIIDAVTLAITPPGERFGGAADRSAGGPCGTTIGLSFAFGARTP